MVNYQTQVLAWVSQQGGATGIAVFMLGFAYAFYGNKMLPGLLAICCAGIGWVGGMVLGELGHFPGPVAAALAMIAFAAIGAMRPRIGVAIGATVVAAVLGAYCTNLFGAPPQVSLATIGVGAVLGLTLSFLAPRTVPLLLTTVLGTALLLIGFVGAATQFLPDIGQTLREWSATYAAVFPMLGGMLAVAAYSFQSMQQRGDMMTGV
ncbi:MAG: hypothetical protein SF069_00125 [Phycisphaerae bacterium]|nr:hypothetical protein [Phycisphaerae bacterium]